MTINWKARIDQTLRNGDVVTSIPGYTVHEHNSQNDSRPLFRLHYYREAKVLYSIALARAAAAAAMRG